MKTLARHELRDSRGVQNTRTKISEALTRVSYLYMFNLCRGFCMIFFNGFSKNFDTLNCS